MSDTDNKWARIAVIVVALVVGAVLVYFQHIRTRTKRVQVKVQAVQLQAAVRAFVTEYGVAPKGDAAAIMAALRGGNERRIVFFEAPTQFLNAKGEFLDRWGERFRFDLRDDANPRIWSTGRNRRDEDGAVGTDDIATWTPWE
jgi:hypothetical protein